MTSNLGTDVIQNAHINSANLDNVDTDINKLLKSFFRAEFLNRIDEIVVFTQLSKNDIIQITKIQIGKLEKLIEKQGYKLNITEAALNRISEIGYNSQYGARPLKRIVQKKIIDPIAKSIISGRYKSGDFIKIDVDVNGELFFDTAQDNALIISEKI
jgi:ATP-dependent Clp protease ATP-binding subunit ClpB